MSEFLCCTYAHVQISYVCRDMCPLTTADHHMQRHVPPYHSRSIVITYDKSFGRNSISFRRFTVNLLSVCCYRQGLITEGVQCDVTHTTSLTIPALSTQQFAVDVVPTGDGLLKMMGRSFLTLVNVWCMITTYSYEVLVLQCLYLYDAFVQCMVVRARFIMRSRISS